MAVPYAPTSFWPPNGGGFLRTDPQTFWVVHAGPMAMQGAQYRTRPAGSSTWGAPVDSEPIEDPLTAVFPVAGSAFAVGQHEIQFRTANPDGPGAWSEIAFFAATSAVTAPTITSGDEVNADLWLLTWTVPAQDGWQVQLLADDSGTPGAVLWESPPLSSPHQHSLLVPHDTSPAVRWHAVRVRVSGVWSEWTYQQVTVDYTTPNIPSVSIRPNRADEPDGWPARTALAIDVYNPPDGPEVFANEIQRQQRTAGRWTDQHGREFAVDVVADQVPLDGTHVDLTVADDTDYRFRAIAVGENRTRAPQSRTLADIAAMHPTLADVAAAYTSLFDMGPLWVE